MGAQFPPARSCISFPEASLWSLNLPFLTCVSGFTTVQLTFPKQPSTSDKRWCINTLFLHPEWDYPASYVSQSLPVGLHSSHQPPLLGFIVYPFLSPYPSPYQCFLQSHTNYLCLKAHLRVGLCSNPNEDEGVSMSNMLAHTGSWVIDHQQYPVAEQVGFSTFGNEGEYTPRGTMGCVSKTILERTHCGISVCLRWFEGGFKALLWIVCCQWLRITLLLGILINFS